MPEILTTETIGQIIGFIALGIAFFAFKETDDRKLLIYLVACSLVWSLHFGIIGLFAASAINLFDVFKNIAGLKWKKNNYWIAFFVLSYILIGIVTYQYTGKLYSFLPSITSVLGAVGVLYFHGIAMRLFLILTLFIWFTYNFIGGSYAGMCSDVVLIGATLYGIYKLKYKTQT